MCTGASGPGRIQVFDVTIPATPITLKYMECFQALFCLTQNGNYCYVSNRGGEQELLVMKTSTVVYG